jgi:hypothetical protein
MFHVIQTRIAYLVAAALAAAACASSGTSAGTGASASVAASPRHDRSVITADDMKDLQVSNLFEVVERLHPEWLVQRNTAGMGRASGRSSSTNDTDVQVYFDMQRAGSTDMLKQLPVTSASSLRYYTASEAQARFGNGNLNGVIQVVTITKP